MNRNFWQASPVHFGAGFLLVSLVAATGWWRHDARGRMIDDWQIEDLVACLHARGLELRIVPTMHSGSVNGGAFLTTTDKAWEQLSRPPATTERLGDWHGTVYCCRASRSEGDSLRGMIWGDSYQRIGPFVLFGDPELRTRIRDTLRDAGLSIQ